jgi:hypothetical protein
MSGHGQTKGANWQEASIDVLKPAKHALSWHIAFAGIHCFACVASILWCCQ